MAQVRMRKLESQGPALSPYRSAAYLRPRRTRARAMPTQTMRRSSSRSRTRQLGQQFDCQQARRVIPLADIGLIVIGDTEIVADHVRSLGYRVNDQMSIFSAISIASSTSMPR